MDGGGWTEESRDDARFDIIMTKKGRGRVMKERVGKGMRWREGKGKKG